MVQNDRAELVAKISKYRRLARGVSADDATTARMATLIAELQEKLDALDTPPD